MTQASIVRGSMLAAPEAYTRNIRATSLDSVISVRRFFTQPMFPRSIRVPVHVSPPMISSKTSRTPRVMQKPGVAKLRTRFRYHRVSQNDIRSDSMVAPVNIAARRDAASSVNRICTELY